MTCAANAGASPSPLRASRIFRKSLPTRAGTTRYADALLRLPGVEKPDQVLVLEPAHDLDLAGEAASLRDARGLAEEDLDGPELAVAVLLTEEDGTRAAHAQDLDDGVVGDPLELAHVLDRHRWDLGLGLRGRLELLDREVGVRGLRAAARGDDPPSELGTRCPLVAWLEREERRDTERAGLEAGKERLGYAGEPLVLVSFDDGGVVALGAAAALAQDVVVLRLGE